MIILCPNGHEILQQHWKTRLLLNEHKKRVGGVHRVYCYKCKAGQEIRRYRQNTQLTAFEKEYEFLDDTLPIKRKRK